MYTLEQLQQKSLKELKEIGCELNVSPTDDRRYRESWIKVISGVNPPLLQLLEVSPSVEVKRAQEPSLESKFGRIVYPRPAQEAIAPVAETPPGVEVDPVQEPISQVAKTPPGVEVDPVQEPISQVAKTSPGVEVDRVQEPISQVAKTSPGVEVDQVELLPDCVVCFGAGYVEDEFGGVTFCQCAPAAKISKSDRNPIVTGIALSDRFLARYAAPQAETLHYDIGEGAYEADTDGQLSLFEARVVSEPEPPDPDDFESLDAFREAIALWDWEHPNSFDHCSELPSSVQNESSSVQNESSSVHCEPLEVSLDSFCEWAPCPADWYESGDRPNGRKEPPDTGAFAYLPKPKPPKFPPQAESQPQVEHKLNSSWTQQISPRQQGISPLSRHYPETIPKLFHCGDRAGSSTQPARSPPGGDA